ncbi:MAG: phosphoribosylglycinamide formyltransferase [Synechococcaceae cyanobacterium]|nr:phosphoribosylglycinamide formyltransferase [Synechococcaceae cyanobacterium]
MPALPDGSGNSTGVDCGVSIQWPPTPTDPPSHRPLRLAVMASGDGSNFEALVQACRAGRVAGQVVLLVVNEPGCGARRRAERLAVPCRLLDHRLQPSREALDQELVAAFEAVGADLVVMAGWMRIVTPRLIGAFADRLLNLHPSLLPSFRGRDGIADSLAAGVTLAGCTAHLVVPEVDAGPILVQAAVPVLPGDDRASLHARIRVQEHRILPLAVRLAAERLATPGSNAPQGPQG